MKIQRIADPSHSHHDHWVVVGRHGGENTRVTILHSGHPTPQSVLVANAKLGTEYQISDHLIDRNGYTFRQFPVTIWGSPNTQSPTGEHSITGPKASVTPVNRPAPTSAPTSHPNPVPAAQPPQASNPHLPSPTIQPQRGQGPARPPNPPNPINPSAQPQATSVTPSVGRASSSSDQLAKGPPVIRVDAMADFIDMYPVDMAIMFWGPPGVGKSDGVWQYGALKRSTVVDCRLSMVDPIDMRGIGVPDLEREICKWLRPDFLPNQPNMILFLDEINGAVPSIQALAYQIALNKRVGEHKLPDDCRVICAGNRESDRGVVYRMPAPLSNRLAHYEVAPEINAWRAWALRSDIDPTIIAFLSVKPQLLFDFTQADNSPAWPSPRSWSRQANFALKSDKPEEMKKIACNAAVGPVATREIFRFRTKMRSYPDPRRILETDGVQPPKRMNPATASTLAVAVALTATEDHRQLDRACRYARQLNDEFGNLLLRSLEDKFGMAKRKSVV